MPSATKKRPVASRTASLEIMNLAEAAKYLRLSPRTIERLVEQQALPGRKIGKEWRFLRAAIERWLEPARAQRGSVLDQFGALANDPTYDEYRKQIEENRRRWNEEVA